jgi:hypothetical protein
VHPLSQGLYGREFALLYRTLYPLLITWARDARYPVKLGGAAYRFGVGNRVDDIGLSPRRLAPLPANPGETHCKYSFYHAPNKKASIDWDLSKSGSSGQKKTPNENAHLYVINGLPFLEA